MKGSGAGHTIRIALLKICLGWAGVLEVALRVMWQENNGVGILKKTKLKKDIHAWHRAGYTVWATESESQNWWGSRGVFIIRDRMAGGRDGKLWPQCGEFTGGIGGA